MTYFIIVMTDFAHKNGLRAGFYENNCICRENNLFGDEGTDMHYQGDVNDLVS